MIELKDKLISSFIAFENQIDIDAPIHDIRVKAMKTFEQKGFPTKKEEAWKYTSIQALLQHNYSIFPKVEKALEFKDVKKYFIHDIDTYKIVFIDGVYSSHLSQITDEGMDVYLMSAAFSNPKHKNIIDTYYNNIAQTEDSLTSLNTAFSKEGAYIYIPKHKGVEKPVQIVYFSTGIEPALMLQPRNLVVVEENAQIQIIERHQSLTDTIVLTNSVTEIFAGKNAVVDYYKVQNDRHTVSLIDNTYILQKQNSNVTVNTFSFGGKLTRNNLNFFHKDRDITSVLKGVTLIGDKQHVDHHTLVHHSFPHCESHQEYKGIYTGGSTGVFNGKIMVDKDAQKTNAFQQNNNLLTSNKATINTKPQLEIFADDVKCSHGCTIGQLDKAALFYMRTRGIPEKEAIGLLMYAFANNVLESVKIPAVKKRINTLIAEKLGVSLGV